MSRIREGKHNYLFYKYIQIDRHCGWTVLLFFFFGNCTSCNQLTPSWALEPSKEKEYSYSCTSFA